MNTIKINKLEDLDNLTFIECIIWLKKNSSATSSILQTYSYLEFIQKIFVKLFQVRDNKFGEKYKEGIHGEHSYEHWEDKKLYLDYFKDNFELLHNILKDIFEHGYYEFVEKLYDNRIVYIYMFLKKETEIEELYQILSKRCDYYDDIFYDFFGNGNHFGFETPQCHFISGFFPEFDIDKLFDENGNIIERNYLDTND